MTVETSVPARRHERIRPAPTGPRRPSPGPSTSPGVTAGASLLAASFAGAEPAVEPAAEPAGWGDGPLTLPRAPLAISGAGAPPRARAGGNVHWVSRPAATVRGPLLDLQRLAGNAAVSAALSQGGDLAGAMTDEARTPGPVASPHDDVPLQRIDIPGLGNIDVAGYIRRALSILGPAQTSRDQAKTDARKQADDAATESGTKAEKGNRDLDAGKAAAERAGEAGFSQTKAATEATAASEHQRTDAAKAHGDHVADEVKGMAPGAGDAVDPLAHETGEPAAAAGHQAVANAYDHAVGSAEVPGEPASPSAEPAVSHGPGPPAPGPGPPSSSAPSHEAGEPAPGIEHAPAQAGKGADHGAPAAPSHTAGEPAPETGHPPAGEGAGPDLTTLPETLPEGATPGAAGGAGPAGAAGGTPVQGAAGGETPKSCELIEAAKTVKGWRDRIRSIASGIVSTIGDIRILGTTVGELSQKALRLARKFRGKLVGLKDGAVRWAMRKAARVSKKISDAMSAARRGFKNASDTVHGLITSTKEAVVAGWDNLKQEAARRIDRAKRRAAAKARAAIARVQGWLRQHEGKLSLLGHVPGLSGAVARLRQFAYARDPLGDLATYLEQKRNAVRDKLRRARDLAVRSARFVVDLAVKTAAAKFQEAKKTVSFVLEAAKKVAPYVAAAVAPGVVLVAGAAKAAANRWGSDLRAGAERVGRALKGEACELIGDTVGPCLDMYLPKPENNVKGFARLTGQADITVPLQELDIPCNVKMGRGASVAVERSSTGYNVSVDGEATVYANLAFAEKGAKSEVKVETPMGGMATVWERLGGGGPPGGARPASGGATPSPTASPGTGGGTPGPAPTAAPASPAPTGAPATPAAAPAGAAPAGAASGGAAPSTGGAPGQQPGAPAQGSGSGVSAGAEVEGGLKASANLKFAFPSTGGTTCEGAGGVASLLGALGVAAALPSPLDMLARSGVVGAWERNLVSNTVTVGLAGSGQVELSKEGLGALKGQGQGEVYVTTGVERPNQWGAATPPPPTHVAGGGADEDRNVNGPYSRPAGTPDPNALRPVLKVGAVLRGEAAGELAVPQVLVAKGGVSGSGKVEALLLYDRPTDRIILQAVTAQAELGLGVSGINPAVVASRLGSPFGTSAAARITSLGLAHSNGSIKVTLTGTANNLQKYIDTVGGYLSRDVSSVSAAGLSSEVRRVYSPSDFTKSVSVNATVSDRLGIEAKEEEIGDEGMKAGVSAKGAIEVGREYQLYP